MSSNLGSNLGLDPNWTISNIFADSLLHKNITFQTRGEIGHILGLIQPCSWAYLVYCVGSSSGSENDEEHFDANQPCIVTVRSGKQSTWGDDVGPDGTEHPTIQMTITVTASAQHSRLSWNM